MLNKLLGTRPSVFSTPLGSLLNSQRNLQKKMGSQLTKRALKRHLKNTKKKAVQALEHSRAGFPIRPNKTHDSTPQHTFFWQRLTRFLAGEFTNVAVLGPERKEAQVEISLTDGRALGVDPPVRMSGDTRDTPGITLKGPLGSITLPHGVIAARRHIHLSPEEAAHFGVTDGQNVSLQTFTDRPAVFQDVTVRVHPQFRAAVHLDFDEANACGLGRHSLGRILP